MYEELKIESNIKYTHHEKEGSFPSALYSWIFERIMRRMSN